MAADLPEGFRLCANCRHRAFRPVGTQRLCADCQLKSPPPPQVAPEAPPVVAAPVVLAPGPSVLPEIDWRIRVQVPFGYHMSKNAIWKSVGNRMILREEGKQARTNLTEVFRDAMQEAGFTPVTHRIWMDILVEKPDHKGDAINVVDLVADALKDAVTVDDRWYSIHALDWRIVKTDPRLVIGIGQEVGAVESQVCSYCGSILPLERFTKNKSTTTGRSRMCVDCSSRKKKVA